MERKSIKDGMKNGVCFSDYPLVQTLLWDMKICIILVLYKTIYSGEP